MLTQRPIGALIRIAKAQSNGGSISNAVRQIWALRAPVIPLRAPVILLRTPALRRRHRPSPGGAGPGPRDRHLTREHVPLADVLAG